MLQFIQHLSRTVLRLVLLAAGLVLAAFLLLVGLVAALGLVAWSLLRGRRPAMVFRAPQRPSWGRMRPGRAAAPSSARSADPGVIDVEMREVPDAAEPPAAPRTLRHH